MSAITKPTDADLIAAGQFLGKTPYLTNEQYHASPGISATGLANFAKLPALYKYNRDKEEDDAETASQRLGSLVHMRALEPKLFEETVVIIAGNGNSTEVKNQIKAAELAGKYICRSEKEFKQVIDMVDSVMSHSWAKTLLTQGEQEQSLYAPHPLYGFLMKCRPDAIHPDKAIIADIKTYTDLDDYALEKQIKRLKYHWKAVHYMNVASLVYGQPFEKFVHVWVSTKAPYPVRCLALGGATVQWAEEKVSDLYAQYSNCLLTNTWPGYPDDIEDFELTIY